MSQDLELAKWVVSKGEPSGVGGYRTYRLAKALVEAAKDTERLNYVISVLEQYGSDGLMDQVFMSTCTYDRVAIDAAKAKGTAK